MVLFVKRWGILAPVLTAVAAVSYDLIGGGVGVVYLNGPLQYTPFVVQMMLVVIPLVLLRKCIRFHLTTLLLIYGLVSSSGVTLFALPLGLFWEPIWLSIYCVAFYDSVSVSNPYHPEES